MAEKGLRSYFLLLLVVFAALIALSWPILFSFDLWVLKDRGNLLNVDYLLEQQLRLGVDAYYIYGLLPVSLQHLAFAVAGRGYWPLLAFDVPYVLLTAFFWAWFVRQTAQPGRWLRREQGVERAATARIVRDRDSDSPQGHTEAPSAGIHVSTVQPDDC